MSDTPRTYAELERENATLRQERDEARAIIGRCNAALYERGLVNLQEAFVIYDNVYGKAFKAGRKSVGAVNLERRIRELSKNSQRYEWIKNAQDQDWNVLLRDGGEILDAAIDAAMKKP